MKKFIRRVLFASIVVLITGPFLGETLATASPNRSENKVSLFTRKPSDPNFKPHYKPEDRKEAEAYSKKKYETWSKDFKKEEKRVLEEYKKKSSKTLEVMRDYRGDMRALRRDAQDKTHPDYRTLKKAVEEIDKIDKLVKVKENKTDHIQTIFTHFNALDMGFSDNNVIEKFFGRIDYEKVQPVIENHKYGQFNDIRVGNLIIDEGAKKERFVMEITVPKGAYLAHLGDGKVLLPSGHGVVVDAETPPTLRVIKGKEVVNFKADLIEKKEIEKTVMRNEELLNSKVVQDLANRGLDVATKLQSLCLFNFHGMSTAYGVRNANEGMEKLLNNPFMAKELLADGLLTLDSNYGITFTDTLIDGNGEVLAKTTFYPSRKPDMIINASSSAYLERWSDHLDIANTIHHEFGHVVDQKILKGISDSETFKKIFEKEKDNISSKNTFEWYARENPAEFFAEVFKSLYSTGTSKYAPDVYHDSIREEAPEAIAFIEKALTEAGYKVK